MRINVGLLNQIAKKQGLTLGLALARANVSRTAYYSLARKDNILPRSIQRLAQALGVRSGALLVEEISAEQRMRRLYKTLETILLSHPEADRENVLHTLLLLQEKPIDRLRRSLARGRHHIHRERN